MEDTMSASWPMVTLGEVLVKSDDWIQLHPGCTYKEVTVRLWGKGPALRREVLGAEIGSTKRLRVHANQFIISRIDARHGASGLIPETLEGAVVSNDFPVFIPDPARLESRFLDWLSRTKGFIELCKAASEGTTNRIRLKEDRFLNAAMPLPPLGEQRRLVKRIDALAAKIQETRHLQREAAATRVMLWLSALETAFRRYDEHTVPVANVLSRVKREVMLQPGVDYLPAGLTNQAKGIIQYPAITSAQTKYQVLFAISEGDLVYSKLKVWEGSLAIVGPEHTGRVVSSEFPMFTVDSSKVLRDYLDLWLRRPSLWAWLGDQVRGIGGRKIRVDEQTFLNAPLQLPPVDVQRLLSTHLQQFRQHTTRVKRLQRDAEAELNAMLPAVLYRAFNGGL